MRCRTPELSHLEERLAVRLFSTLASGRRLSHAATALGHGEHEYHSFEDAPGPGDVFHRMLIAKLGDLKLLRSDEQRKYIEITDRGRDWLADHEVSDA